MLTWKEKKILWVFEAFPTFIQTKFNSQSREKIKVTTEFPTLMEALDSV